MIQISSLCKNYGLFEAIRDISFQIPKGDVVGFLGPNGAGKTTTMRILCGCIGSTEGSIMIDGIDMLKDPIEAKKKIGYLPETPPVYPNMTVYQYLIFSAKIRHVADPIEATQKVIETMDLQDVQDRIIAHLSKGFRQRVGLAQALIHDPEILVLDEPVSGLDPKQRKEVRDVIKKLAQGQRTIILSTHVLSEVEAICNRVIMINGGRIVARDTLQNLQEKALELQLKVARPSPSLQHVLQNVDGVSDVRFEEDTTDNSGIFYIKITNDDVREHIAKTAVDYGILEFTASKSLEDIYLRIQNTSSKIHSEEHQKQHSMSSTIEKATE